MKEQPTGGFKPFDHKNLELKNALINYARELKDKEGFENHLAATFIYANFAEYLAGNLIEHLRYFVYYGSYNQFAGILFIDERTQNKPKTMGQNIAELNKFDFPDKKEISTLLSEISKKRNNIFHNFADADPGTLEQIISKDFKDIRDKTEELLQKINTVYAGLQKILIPQPAKQQDSNGDIP